MNNVISNQRIARNTLFLYIRMGVVMLIALYTTRVVLNVLGTDDYGTYNVVCGFVAMFGIFNTSFSNTINRYYNFEIGKKTENGVRIVFNSAVLIQFLLSVIVISIVEPIGCWYIDNVMVLPVERVETAKWIFHFAIVSMFFTIMQAPFSAAVMAFEKMDFFAIVSVFDAFLKLSFVIILQFLGSDKLLLYGILMCFISIINFIMYFFYCRLKFLQIRLQLGLNKQVTKSMLSFSGWSALDPATYMIRDQGTNILLNSFFGPIVNAAQGIAYQVATAVDYFSSSFSTSFRPQIIQSYSEGQYNRTKNLMLSMSKISYMLHLMIVVPIILEIESIFNLWLGEGYPNYATSFACIILCVNCINTLNSPISTIVAATGKIRKIKIFSAITITIIIPVSFVLFKLNFPPVTSYAVLFVLTIINQCGCVIILYNVFPYLKSSEYLNNLVLPLLLYTISISVIPILLCGCMPSGMIRFILVFAFAILGGIAAGYYIVLNKTEKKLLKDLVDVFLVKLRK